VCPPNLDHEFFRFVHLDTCQSRHIEQRVGKDVIAERSLGPATDDLKRSRCCIRIRNDVHHLGDIGRAKMLGLQWEL
jgi:hypothetical protein